MKNNTHINELVKRSLRGDPVAYKSLYNKYVKAMFNVAIRIVGQQADAEDVVQEAFLNAFQQLHQYKANASFGAWLKRITVNVALNKLRAKKRELSLKQVNYQERIEEEKEQVAYSVESIHRAIKELPEGSRVVVNLYLIEGYQHKEIAEILGISESTSKSQYHRGKKLLKSILKKDKSLSYAS